MKRAIYAVLMTLALARWAGAQPATTGYTNYGEITSPVNVDGTNFVNYGLFNFSLQGYTTGPYYFSSVQAYDNLGGMDTDNGFVFDTEVPNQFGNPVIQPAAVFLNENTGT